MADQVLGSLRSRLPGYFDISSSGREQIYRHGLVVPDTNILLDLYRFRGEARTEVLAALKSCGERLFVPNRVAYEFMGTRVSVIRSRSTESRGLLGSLDKVRDETKKVLKSAQEMAALPESEVDLLIRELADSMRSVKEKLRDLLDEKNAVAPGAADVNDSVLHNVDQLLIGRVGAPLELSEMEAIRGQAVTRFERRIPPGFEDGAKDFEKAIGDYVLWVQLLIEAKRRSLPVLLITGDTKTDWIRRDGAGRSVGLHPSLVAEMRDETGLEIIWADVTTFLEEAKGFLSVSVSPRTLDESRSVRSSENRSRRIRDERQRIHSTSREQQELGLLRLIGQREGIAQEVAEITQQLSETSSSGRRLVLQRQMDRFAEQLTTVDGLIGDVRLQLAAADVEESEEEA